LSRAVTCCGMAFLLAAATVQPPHELGFEASAD
jgi:hypothetical protein